MTSKGRAMTVREFIELLQGMPQNAIMIHTMASDYCDIKKEDVSLMQPKDGQGLIRHHGHLMFLRAEWWPKRPPGGGARPDNPEFLTAVHIIGN
jgi:hypothetical protein